MRDLGLVYEHVLVVEQLIMVHRIVVTLDIEVVGEVADMGDVSFIVVLVREFTLKSGVRFGNPLSYVLCGV